MSLGNVTFEILGVGSTFDCLVVSGRSTVAVVLVRGKEASDGGETTKGKT